MTPIISLLLLLYGFVFSGCVSVFKPIQIENHHISAASFSCSSLTHCWAFTDGDTNSADSGIRRGFLELNDYSWKRKRDWRNWYGFLENDRFTKNSTSLSFLNEETGWLVIDGKLYKRTPSYHNGGWEFSPNPFSVDYHEPGTIKEVFFVDPLHGWLLSHTGQVAITTDGGNQWETNPVLLGNTYSALFFLDSMRGWIIADNTYVLQTNNGGKDWVRVGFLFSSGEITQLRFLDENHAWLVMEGHPSPSHSDNGGLTWVHPQQEAGSFQSVYFWDPFHGWAIQPGKGIVHTADGGRTWHNQEISDYWHEHPINVIWKTPVWILGTITLFITSIFNGLPEEFDSLPLLPILQI